MSRPTHHKATSVPVTAIDPLPGYVDEDEVETTRVTFTVPTTSYGSDRYRVDVPTSTFEEGDPAVRRWILDNTDQCDLRDSDTHDTNSEWNDLEID